jgi:hypothetical protein
MAIAAPTDPMEVTGNAIASGFENPNSGSIRNDNFAPIQGKKAIPS